MAAVITGGYVLLVVAVTWLATVHWLPLGGEEPAMVARGGRKSRKLPVS